MQAKASVRLPTPDATSAAHSERCRAYILEKIVSAGGSLSFADYMQYALYAPGLGYYTAGSAKFGTAGDFVTAPEVSPIFGRIIARQCAAMLAQMDNASILEIGAGSGRLAIDVLLRLATLDALPADYLILEVSPDLTERQASLIQAEVPQLADRVRWISELPAAHCGIVIANEVLDALPVERFVRRADILQQRVAADADGFELIEKPAPAVLAEGVAEIETTLGHRLPDAYVSELALAAPNWVRDVIGSLAEGVLMLFDYGVSRREYYAAERNGGWLRCHFRHRVHNDALILPGIQDLTAWVDFSTIASAAVDAGALVGGYTNQSAFLIAGGLEQELQSIASLPSAEQAELSRQIKMLTLPGEMGEHFKCMALVKGAVTLPDAFQVADRTHAL